jgi:hypothetical protein
MHFFLYYLYILHFAAVNLHALHAKQILITEYNGWVSVFV